MNCEWCFDEIKTFATNFTKETEGKPFCSVSCADSYTQEVKLYEEIEVNYIPYEGE